MRYLGVLLNITINLVTGVVFLSFFTKNDFQAFLIVILLTIGYIGLTFTPFGIWLFRKKAGVRNPDQMEAARVNPIFQRVYQGAKTKNPLLPSNIEWFMHDDASLNAFACGPNTIGINVGLLSFCNDKEIAAILAHEFAHIAHKDTIITTVCIQSNVIAFWIHMFFRIIIRVVGGVVSLLIGFVSECQWMADIFGLATRLVDWVFNLYVSVVYWIGSVASYASSRQQEYAADRYAAELGLARPLIDVFRKFPKESEFTLQADIAHLLYGTHPKIEDRIAKLQEYINANKKLST